MGVEHWYYTIRLRVRSLFQRRQVEQELNEELQYHLDQQIEAYLATGMSADDARYAAIKAMKGIELQKEQCRATRRTKFIDQLVQDLSYGLHVLRSKPGFTFIAILTLALGIGASTAVFSAEDAVIFRPLPYKQPDRLVQVFQSYRPRPYMNRMPVSPANYSDLQKESKSFEGFAAYKLVSLNLSGDNTPERVRAGQVTTNTFSLLGVEPLFGRAFQDTDDAPNSEQVAVLSYNLWQSRYAGSKDIIGKVIKGNNKPFTVIGVMPQGFGYPKGWLYSGDIEIWTPLVLTDTEKNDRGGIILDVIARLKPNTTLEQAQANLDVITSQLEQAYPQTNKGWGSNLMWLSDRGVDAYRSMFLFISLSVLVVLLIACSNVANLLLARGIERQKELTIRAALGADRWRIIRQLLTEGVLLSTFGGVLGVLLAGYALSVLATLPISSIPELKHVAMNWRVLGFSIGLTVVTGLIFSLLPALTLSKFSLTSALQEGGRSAGDSSGRSRLKSTLVVGELALTILLLLCAGKLIRSFQSYMSVDPGFVPDNVLTMRIVLPTEKYKQSQQWTAFFEGAEQEIKSIPGVILTAAGSGAPMDGYGETSRFQVIGKPTPDIAQENSFADYMRIGRDYFQVAGIKLQKGRYFNDIDIEGKQQIAMVNESFARHAFVDQDPIGQRISLLGNVNDSAVNKTDNPALEIVGVVADTKEYGVFRPTPPMIYVPMRQDPIRTMTLMVKTGPDGTNLLPEIRRHLLKLDPDQPVYNVSTLERIVSDSNALFRFNTMLLTAFAGIALTLALIGIYGVIGYSVGQRTKEFGIRLALGASPGDIFKQVLGKAARLSVFGLGIGLAASYPAIKLLSQSTQRSLGIGLIGSGPMLVVTICAAMTLVTMLACLVPARRATKVDPMTALRAE